VRKILALVVFSISGEFGEKGAKKKIFGKYLVLYAMRTLQISVCFFGGRNQSVSGGLWRSGSFVSGLCFLASSMVGLG